MKNALLSYMIAMMLISCKDDVKEVRINDLGEVVSKPYVWSAYITENDQDQVGVRNGVMYDRTVVIGSLKNGRDGFTGFDVDTGEIQWEWYDDLDFYPLDISQFYLHKNYFVWENGRELHCVDISNGTTKWKQRYGTDLSPFFNAVNGIGEKIFVIAGYPFVQTAENPQNVCIYETSVSEGPELREAVVIPPGPTPNLDNIGTSAGQHVAIIDSNQDTLIFSDNYYPLDKDWNGESYISLYNLSRKSWVYDKTLLPGIASHSMDKPKYHNGIVYLAMSPFIVAVELLTGRVIWQWTQPLAGFGTSGFILVPEKNLIVFNAETFGTTMYALELGSGHQIWEAPSSGTSSHLKYLNGVVYWVGGGDGYLHAVDIDSGKSLWKIISPDEATNGDAFFARYCAVFPGENGEKGKIVVTSGLHAFAYEEADRE